MDNLTPDQRRKNMQNIRSKDTESEVLLRKTLWKKGYRYRKNYSKLPGKPDIVLTKYKIVVFCDGEFFHGKEWNSRREKVLEGNHSEYWFAKIERNMERDRENEKTLEAMGWTVIRFWSRDILADPEKCLRTIEECILQNVLQKRDI